MNHSSASVLLILTLTMCTALIACDDTPAAKHGGSPSVEIAPPPAKAPTVNAGDLKAPQANGPSVHLDNDIKGPQMNGPSVNLGTSDGHTKTLADGGAVSN